MAHTFIVLSVHHLHVHVNDAQFATPFACRMACAKSHFTGRILVNFQVLKSQFCCTIQYICSVFDACVIYIHMYMCGVFSDSVRLPPLVPRREPLRTCGSVSRVTRASSCGSSSPPTLSVVWPCVLSPQSRVTDNTWLSTTIRERSRETLTRKLLPCIPITTHIHEQYLLVESNV